MSGRFQLVPQPWMTAPATRRVMAALDRGGAEARFVGGCVRDALLDRPVRDIDIATPAPPERVIELLEAAGIKAIPTGIAHGTVTAVADGEPFEITTLRVDVQSHGRHADVAFTEDWDADAARRDFTINAMSMTPDGTVFDPFGGLADLERGRVRFVGDAAMRIREDVLRLLRYFRFFAWYDSPPPDPAAMAAARDHAHLLPGLSGERVWAELSRLLAAPDPAPVLHLMADAGVLDQVLPQAASQAPPQARSGAHRIGLLAALVGIERQRDLAGGNADPLRRLAALLETDGADIDAIAARLRLSRRDRQRLAWLAEDEGAVAPGLDDRAARRMIYLYGPETFCDLVLLSWACALVRAVRETGRGQAPGAAAEFGRLLDLAEIWAPPALPVSGKDAVALGLAPGPAVGAALARVENWWMERDFAPGREACLEKLKELVTRS